MFIDTELFLIKFNELIRIGNKKLNCIQLRWNRNICHYT